MDIREKLEQLNLAIKDSMSYDELVEEATKIIGNPMVIYDITYTTWAYTKNVNIDDFLWTELTTTGTFSPDTVKYIQGEFVDAYMKSSPVSFMKSKLNYDRINGSIFIKKGVQAANVVMLDVYRPFCNDDYILIERFCDILAKRIIKSGAILRQYKLQQLVGDFLSGKISAKSLCELNLNEFYRHKNRVLYISVVDIMQFDPTLTHIMYFCKHLKTIREGFNYYVHLNNIVILMSFKQDVLNIESELKEFNEFFTKYNIYAGVSASFLDLKDARKHFQQAFNALNYGMIIGKGNIFSFDIFRTELFVNSHLDGENIKELCHPLAIHIKEYDKKHKTDYTEKIYTYLLYGMDFKLASSKLDINIIQLKKSIQKASRIFCIDFKNGNLLYSIMRSIRLMKCFLERF